MDDGPEHPMTNGLRHHPRLEVVNLTLEETHAPLVVSVLNCSEGGVLVATNKVFAIDETREFRFHTIDGGTTAHVFEARVRHVRAASDHAHGDRYFAGLQFAPRTDRQRSAIRHLLAMCGETPDSN